MRVLISSIGSRGEVQPVLALALELRALGHEAVLCVAPNFKAWVESRGVPCVPIGPDLRQFVKLSVRSKHKKPSRAQWRQLNIPVVREQFEVTARAARGCDLIVVCGALQTAGRSIAELMRIPYVYAAYAPVTLPSPDHPPPKYPAQYRMPWLNRLRWMHYERNWNHIFLPAVNEQRTARGLAPVSSMSSYVQTGQPWLAADGALAPAGKAAGLQISQTGAWLLQDSTPLPDALEAFLSAGAPPVYFGFGSMGKLAQASPMLIEAARALGLRAVISQGWADLDVLDSGPDCIAIGDVSHEKLLPRVAAVVHHGGAGTTTAAARAGRPQVVIPHLYDQYYWAHRVEQLDLGVSGPLADQLTTRSLLRALRTCLGGKAATSAQAFASRIELHGARVAAERLIRDFSRGATRL